MTDKQSSNHQLTNREFLEFTQKLEAELASMALERGMHSLVPAFRNASSISKIMLDKMGR